VRVRILAVTHGDDVGPELFADVALAEGHELDEWDIPARGAPPRSVDAVTVFGGHQNVGEEDRYPWLHEEYAALTDWVGAGVPLLAVCLGAQTLAHALQGEVRRLDEPLAGFYPTELTGDGVADPVLGSLPRSFECFNGNAYAVSLPQDSALLATGPCLQAFRVGDRAWAVQFHPEIQEPGVVASWFDDDPRPGLQEDELANELRTKLPRWRPLGTRLFNAFLAEAER
jgi:GMP synthase-like glutamine amidotransferase